MIDVECDLMQSPDGSWWIHKPRESGLVETFPLGVLEKEQAIRETLRRGFTKITCWDKTVLAEIQKGTVYLDKRTLEK